MSAPYLPVQAWVGRPGLTRGLPPVRVLPRGEHAHKQTHAGRRVVVGPRVPAQGACASGHNGASLKLAHVCAEHCCHLPDREASPT